MIKAEKFQEQVEGILKDRQDFEKRKINKDIKLVEDELEDLYERIERARESNGEIPKYAEVNKILEKPVADDLILNQGFLLDITNDKHTRIYYNKNDFENRVKKDNTSLNDKQREFLNKASKVSMGDYEKHTSKDKRKTKTYTDIYEFLGDIQKEIKLQINWK